MTQDTCVEAPVRAPSPKDRKRHSSSEAAPVVNVPQVTACEVKRAKPAVANHGWGELFKDRDTFVEMHIC